MKHTRQNKAPIDGEERRKVKPVICYPLKVEIFRADAALLKEWFSPERSGYPQSHGR